MNDNNNGDGREHVRLVHLLLHPPKCTASMIENRKILAQRYSNVLRYMHRLDSETLQRRAPTFPLQESPNQNAVCQTLILNRQVQDLGWG